MLILFCMTLSRWNLNLASFCPDKNEFEKVGHGVMWIFAYGEGSLLVTQFGFMERKNIGRILVSRGRAHLWKLIDNKRYSTVLA